MRIKCRLHNHLLIRFRPTFPKKEIEAYNIKSRSHGKLTADPELEFTAFRSPRLHCAELPTKHNPPFPMRLFPVISNGAYKAWSKSNHSSVNSPTSTNSANCFLLGSELCHLLFQTLWKAEIHHLRGYTLYLTRYWLVLTFPWEISFLSCLWLPPGSLFSC